MESEENYETGRAAGTESLSPLRYKQGKFYAGAWNILNLQPLSFFDGFSFSGVSFSPALTLSTTMPLSST